MEADSGEGLDKFESLVSNYTGAALQTSPRTLLRPSSVPAGSSTAPARRRTSHAQPTSQPSPPSTLPLPSRIGRKLSLSIRWKTTGVVGGGVGAAAEAADLQDIGRQSRCLCSQHIRTKLKRNGLFSRKLGLQRLSSLASLLGGPEICEVFCEMSLIAGELERLHPAVYSGISRQLNMVITSEKTVRTVVTAVAGDLFLGNITWAKVISLYAVAGSLAVECVKLGHPEYLSGLIESVGLVSHGNMGQWIALQGGWVSLLIRYRPSSTEPSIGRILITGGAGLLMVALALMVMVRVIGRALSEIRLGAEI